MAYICMRPPGSCKSCEHYRWDVDYGAMSCFAELDERDKQYIATLQKTHKRGVHGGDRHG